MDNFDYLPKLHSCETLIVKEVKRICDENGIKYFMIAGTLLGAVRHKGFIPWDDDMDIGMLRADYEKFIDLAQKSMSDKFFLQTTETDSAYGLNFAKFFLKAHLLKRLRQQTEPQKVFQLMFFPLTLFRIMPKKRQNTINGHIF